MVTSVERLAAYGFHDIFTLSISFPAARQVHYLYSGLSLLRFWYDVAMNSIPCDIVLLPDDTLTEKAIAASRTLTEHDPLFTLEIGKFYPHMSLYMFQLNADDIPKVEEILSALARSLPVISCTATKYKLGEGFALGYIDPEYEASDTLRDIQTWVIEAVNPIRAGMREKDIAKMQDATGLKLENLQKYGFPSVGELFRPHVTLSRLKDYKPEVLELLPDIRSFDGNFNRIGLFEMGDNGTCVRQISEFKLSA
jgi:hypothetical protein